MLDIDVVYTGVSRGFSSELDWKTDSIAHKLAFGTSAFPSPWQLKNI